MRLAVVLFVVLFSLAPLGCSRPPVEAVAHGKPAAHWLDQLKQPEAKARKKAVTALGLLGKAEPEAMPALIAALKDRDAGVRRAAVVALVNLGPDASEAVPALTQISQRDADPAVRAQAAKALQHIQSASD